MAASKKKLTTVLRAGFLNCMPAVTALMPAQAEATLLLGSALVFFESFLTGAATYGINILSSDEKGEARPGLTVADEIGVHPHLARLAAEAVRHLIEETAEGRNIPAADKKALLEAAGRAEEAWMVMLESSSGAPLRKLDAELLAKVTLEEIRKPGKTPALTMEQWLLFARYVLGESGAAVPASPLASLLAVKLTSGFSRHFRRCAEASFTQDPPAFAALLLQFQADIRTAQSLHDNEFKHLRGEMERVLTVLNDIATRVAAEEAFNWNLLSVYLASQESAREEAERFYQEHQRNWTEMRSLALDTLTLVLSMSQDLGKITQGQGQIEEGQKQINEVQAEISQDLQSIKLGQGEIWQGQGEISQAQEEINQAQEEISHGQKKIIRQLSLNHQEMLDSIAGSNEKLRHLIEELLSRVSHSSSGQDPQQTSALIMAAVQGNLPPPPPRPIVGLVIAEALAASLQLLESVPQEHQIEKAYHAVFEKVFGAASHKHTSHITCWAEISEKILAPYVAAVSTLRELHRELCKDASKGIVLPLATHERRSLLIALMPMASRRIGAVSLAFHDELMTNNDYLDANIEAKKNNPQLVLQRIVVVNDRMKPNKQDMLLDALEKQVAAGIELRILNLKKYQAAVDKAGTESQTMMKNLILLDGQILSQSLNEKNKESGEIIIASISIRKCENTFNHIWQQLADDKECSFEAYRARHARITRRTRHASPPASGSDSIPPT